MRKLLRLFTAMLLAGATSYPVASIEASNETILLADNVRRVPKEKEKAKEPPKLPESAIPGASNPRDNYDPPPSSSDTNKGGGVKNVKLPDVKDDQCKGSPNCSKTFDGGK